MRSSIFLVRRARSVPPTLNGPNEYQRPLTETGRAQANQLADFLADLDPSAIVSSPDLRAVQTLEPAARQWNLPIHTDPRLREWNSGIEPTPDYVRHYAQSWAHPQWARPGAESLCEPTERAVHTLTDIVAGLQRRPAIVGSHGTFIARALIGLGCSGVSWAFQQAMPMLAIYRIEIGGPTVYAVGPGL
ncbi:histidine phosphatase family protein [Nocardia speluncae]|uniref:Histidine phosphatase family protein n=1 Tax=Nocardia speluncae TaxID=419477 RepID=A0A846XP28_9NOCA|nr:histidine phosphatase family protein [Nocardia speluncae]NKY36446.1 histidine phosphatase family protein [Nocardia speluncae]